MFDVFKKMLRASVGLVIAGLGIYFTMQANIGLAPWDALNQGIADMFGTSFGNVSVACRLWKCIAACVRVGDGDRGNDAANRRCDG